VWQARTSVNTANELAVREDQASPPAQETAPVKSGYVGQAAHRVPARV
jgi:hypothetical protein